MKTTGTEHKLRRKHEINMSEIRQYSIIKNDKFIALLREKSFVVFWSRKIQHLFLKIESNVLAFKMAIIL